MQILDDSVIGSRETVILCGVEHTRDGLEVMNLLQRFKKIEEKNRCVRVRFLDWLSVKLVSWSIAVKETANRIDSPCVIKLGDAK